MRSATPPAVPVSDATDRSFPYPGSIPGPASRAVVAAASNPFGRLVALYQSNGLLLTELNSVGRKMRSAREQAESPGGGSGLARAYLLRLKARHTAALTLLRANRAQARDLLARLDAGGPRVNLS